MFSTFFSLSLFELLARRADMRGVFLRVLFFSFLGTGDVVVIVVVRQWLSGLLLSQSFVFFCLSGVWPLSRSEEDV